MEEPNETFAAPANSRKHSTNEAFSGFAINGNDEPGTPTSSTRREEKASNNKASTTTPRLSLVETSYLLDVAGDNSGDTFLGGGGEGLSASLLSAESQSSFLQNNTSTSTRERLSISPLRRRKLGGEIVKDILEEAEKKYPLSSAKKSSAKKKPPAKTAKSQSTSPLKTPAKKENSTKKKPGGGPSSIITGHLLSPFSPLLQHHPKQNKSRTTDTATTSEETIDDAQSKKDGGVTWATPSYTDGDLSLQPCRKVSVVVHVSYQSSSSSSSNQQQHQQQQNDEESRAFTEPTDASTTATSVFSNSGSPRHGPATTNAANTTATSTKVQQLCLFPMMLDDGRGIGNDANHNPERRQQQQQQQEQQSQELSPTSATLQASSNSRDLVVVNPSAFGKFIPSEITMQTAKLVAQVANIESEDWARTYRFQQVIWPGEAVRSLTHLAHALANDVLVYSSQHNEDTTSSPDNSDNSNTPAETFATSKMKGKRKSKGAANSTTSTGNQDKHNTSTSRVVIGTGSSHDKMRTLFGRSKTATTTASRKTTTTSTMTKRSLLEEYGLLGATFDSILRQLPHYAVCALSVYEILQEDDIHDLLAPSPTAQVSCSCTSTKVSYKPNDQNKILHVRQPRDRKGAVIEGLKEYPVDSLESLRECLTPILSSSTKHTKKSRENSYYKHTYQGGHIIVSLKVWQSAVQHDLNLQTRCATLTFVNLAVGESSQLDGSTNHQTGYPYDLPSPARSATASYTGPSNSIPSQRQSPRRLSTRQTSFLRTSASSLGGVLRGALLREAGSEAIMQYRDSTLTKVLQRSLDHPDSRVVVLASLSPLSDAYDGTLATLRYVERLLVRSELPKSPFEKRSTKVSSPKHSSPQNDDGPLSPASSTRPSPPSQAQILMEQFAGREQLLKSVITDPRQRLARFYRSQQHPSPTESLTSHNGDHLPWKGPESPDSYGTDCMKMDPANRHHEVEQSEAQDLAATTPELAGNNDEHLRWKGPGSPDAYGTDHTQMDPTHIRPNGEATDPQDSTTPETPLKPQPEDNMMHATPLAKYIMPPLSPVANHEEHDLTSLGDTSRQDLPLLETTGTFESNVSELRDFSPTSRQLSSAPKPNESRRMQSDKSNSISGSIGMYQEPTKTRTTSTGFFKEIATLESSVDAMKNAHFGIWQSSASSIRHLKEFQIAQQQVLNDLIVQRDNAVGTARKSQEEVLKLSQNVDDLRKEQNAEIAALREIVDTAESDRADVEKIADEAITAHDTLEHTVTELEKKLISNRNSSQAAHDELQRLSQSKDGVSEELYSTRSELFALKSNLNELQITVTELQFQLKNAEKERVYLSRLHAEDEEVLAKLTEEIDFNNGEQESEREEWRKKISDLQRENKFLASKRGTRESELAEQLAKADDTLKQCRAELDGTREDLQVLRQQDELAAKTMEREVGVFLHEIAQLKSALATAESDKGDTIGLKEQYRAASTELERTRGDLGQRISDVQELSTSLQQALEDQEALKEELGRKERALESFQLETRQRVQRVVKYRDDAASLLDKTVEENRTLVDTNERMQEALHRLKTERDEAVRSREASRGAFSDIQSYVEMLKREQHSNTTLERERDALKRERDNLRGMLREAERDHATIQNEHRRAQGSLTSLHFENDRLQRERIVAHEQRNDFRRQRDSTKDLLHPDVHGDRDDTSTQNERRRTQDALSSLQLEIDRLQQGTQSGLRPLQQPADMDRHTSSVPHSRALFHGDNANAVTSDAYRPTSDLSVRAEEIAACIAFSARQSMHHQGRGTSPSNTRNGQLLSDSEDKELLIAALKRKVKLLERALVFRGEEPPAGQS